MDFLTIFNWFANKTNATVTPSVSSLAENKTSYTNDSTKATQEPEVNITKRKIRRKKPRSKITNKPHKLVTYAKSHPSIDTEYNIVKLTWDKSNNPVIACSDNTADITNSSATNQASYIFKQHSGIVKVAEDNYLNTATGKIYNQATIDTKKIEWQGSYLQKYSNNKTAVVEGERTTINNLPASTKPTKSSFDSDSDSDSEGLSADYAGSASEDEVFLTANSEIESN